MTGSDDGIGPGAGADALEPLARVDALDSHAAVDAVPRADALRDIDLPAVAAAPGAWLELSIEADHEAVEAVSEILSRAAPGGTSVEAAFERLDEGLGARVDTERPAIVRAHLPLLDPDAVRSAVGRADVELGHLQAFGIRPIGELRARVVREEDWADAWKRHFPVLRIGRRIVIRPTWRRHRRGPEDIVLALDPGMAFGTGLHPTTRLCLAALEALADRGLLEARGVLDVGSGSGILSIAAARLRARTVVAVDVDPIAVDATAANARRNRVSRRVHARLGSVPTGGGPFDVVVANLVASLLVSLADGLVADLAPGGTLLASGIVAAREGDVVEAFRARGLAVVRRHADGDWLALEAVRA